MAAVKKTKFCEGISDISDSYSGFIIDQWGVLHDGKKPYDGVVDCLKQLKERGKFIIILSNSGKRADINKERMKKIGIGPSLYDVIVTSGEMTWQGLHDQDEGFFKDLGKKCCLISRGGDRTIVDGLDLEIVEDAAEADFLLISGVDAPDKTMDDYDPILKAAARKQLTAICANPDMRGVMGAETIMGAGALAMRYRELGGVAHYIGKPHQPIFKHCIKLLQEQEVYPGQTVVVGDAMAHDILGASMMQMDTCFVKNGLHARNFQNALDPAAVDKALNMLVAQHNNIRPNYLVETMKWGKPLPDRKHKKRSK